MHFSIYIHTKIVNNISIIKIKKETLKKIYNMEEYLRELNYQLECKNDRFYHGIRYLMDTITYIRDNIDKNEKISDIKEFLHSDEIETKLEFILRED